MKRVWLRRLGEVALVLVVFLGVRAWQTRDAASGPAPALPGLSFSGQPTVVYFWATWCGVCKAQAGNIDVVAKSHRVVTVASQSGEPAAVEAFLKKAGRNWNVVADPEGDLAARWGVKAFPTTFFVDAQGNIVTREAGYTTTAGLWLRNWWAGL